MFGKKMNNMNVSAGHVTVTGPGGVPGAPGVPGATPGTTPGGTRVGGRFGSGSLKGIASLAGYGNIAMAAGGTALMGLGESAGGYDTAGGSVLKSSGMGLTALGGARMVLGDEALKKGLARKAIGGGGRMVGSSLGAATAGVAAIGALSYGAGSYIGGKFNDDSVKSRSTSALGGAAAGAAIGATIGSFVPIIGTGIGAALGAAIGGLTGYWKAGKQRKETRKAAEALVDDYGSKINEAIEGGNVDDLMLARNQLLKDKQKLINSNADPAYAAKAVAKYDEQFKALNTTITNYTGNTSLAEQAFGVSAEALNNLAFTAGIDLTSKMLTLKDILNLVGKSAEDNARLMKQAWSGIGASVTGGVMSRIDRDKQATEASKNIDAAQLKLIGGDTSDSAIKNLVEQSMLFGTAKYGDLGGTAVAGQGLIDAFGEGGALANISQTAKDKIAAYMSTIGMTPEMMISDIKAKTYKGSDGKEIGGIDYLGQLIGPEILATSGLTNKDGTTNSQALERYVLAKQKKDPFYLANLENASVQAGMVNEKGVGEAMLEKSFTTGQVKGVYGTSSYNGGATVTNPTTNTVTVNVSGNVDQRSITQIRDVVDKALRESKERTGQSGGM
jgi:hypothetical protein